jgi:hypothetical protein
MIEQDYLRLITLLDKAEHLASQFTGGHSGRFLSAEELHQSLLQSINKLKKGDASQLNKLYTWFLPTTCWDDFVGKEGQELANEICTILQKLITNE